MPERVNGGQLQSVHWPLMLSLCDSCFLILEESEARAALRDARHQNCSTSSSHVLLKSWVGKCADMVALHGVFAKVLGIHDGSSPSVPKPITSVFPIYYIALDMAPSSTPVTGEPIVSTKASEAHLQPIEEGKESAPLPASSRTSPTAPAAAPTYEQKNYHEVLSYEDKWIGWDGPVWCNRYGRFESKVQAAEDDGYISRSPVTHQDPEPHDSRHCERQGCACRVPFEHRSYVKDIQRRIEPMTASLIVLEHQVAKLVHGLGNDGGGPSVGEQPALPPSSAGLHHQPDGPLHPEHFEHKRHQHMAETVAKLEAKVHSLTHQLHVLAK